MDTTLKNHRNRGMSIAAPSAHILQTIDSAHTHTGKGRGDGGGVGGE